MVQAWLPGPSMQILVDAARPEAGVLAVSVMSDDFPQGVFKDPWPVLCAVCEQDCGKHPRQWGHPLYKAFMAALEEDAGWPRARDWEVEDIFTDWYETRLRKLVDAHEEELTGERRFRYGPFKGRDDPPGRGAPEKGQGPETVQEAGGEGVDHPLSVDEALEEVRAARDAEARALERLGEALRAEHAAGAGKRELGRRTCGVLSLPLVRRALAEGGQGVDHLEVGAPAAGTGPGWSK
ncbi:hypothetical protein HUT19_41640 (plasmid) [Streptomyces sp. NA02950]|uniref:hypothetical protein n=1 Tax=Streptomyces sp. NA02950 TaxID=2742137 RepID=UPI0015907590|nr:hypothetical protein [Streptomyces sp. NA02950]QKV98226.1 hypothetical protein HUT19_41640 [Streptomyces sp. NA02950]